MPRSDDPFEVIEKAGPNAHKINLPGEYEVSATFNVADLSPYYDEDEEFSSLRSNSIQPREYDGDNLIEPPNLSSSTPQQSSNTKEVKELHTLVKNIINQSNSLLPSSTKNWPDFINLLG